VVEVGPGQTVLVLGTGGVIVHGVFVGSRQVFEAMNRAIELHRIEPAIDRVFAFAEAKEAYRYMKSAAHFGKIVMEIFPA
jgi:NADPH:quinone reductase-like Zn-dependent oxidoreductase